MIALQAPAGRGEGGAAEAAQGAAQEGRPRGARPSSSLHACPSSSAPWPGSGNQHIPADISLGVANGLSAVAFIEQQVTPMPPHHSPMVL